MKAHFLAVLLTIFAFTSGLQLDDSITSYFCTKTAYRFSSNTDVTDITQEELDSVEKVWMFIRHGTRNPSKGDINDFKDRLPEIQAIILKANKGKASVLDDNELELFRQWSPIVQDVEYQQILTPEGGVENIELAQRMQTRYPNIFPSVFDNDTYLFMYTDSQRTEESAKHFAIGLFGAENIEDVYFPELTYDDEVVLEFYDICTKWIEEIEDNSDSLVERKAFEKTDIYLEAIDKVNEALGLTDELAKKDVKIMYKACAFETSWSRNTSSPWCIPFEVDTIKAFAYAEDLEYYWVDGYGNALNYEQACPAFGDMIKFFENESDRKATLYFTHSGAVIKFIAHLGLFKDDEDLLAVNFETKQDRKWRTSKLGNFATNVAVLLHDIDGSKKISVRQNEFIMRLPACPDSDLCDLETVKEYYYESINECNFNEMCGLD